MTLNKDTVPQPFFEYSKNISKSFDMKGKKLKAAKKYVSSPLAKPPLEVGPCDNERPSQSAINDTYSDNFKMGNLQNPNYDIPGISNSKPDATHYSTDIKLIDHANAFGSNFVWINREASRNYPQRNSIIDNNFPLLQDDYYLSPLTEQSSDGWLPCGLPSYFNPRKASNMHHGEKVDHWIKNLPYWSSNGNAINVECYNNEYDLDWEEIEFEDLNCVAQKPFIDLIDWEDIVFFQSKKLDALVRKGYMQEKQPIDFIPTVEFNEYSPENI